MKTLDLPADIGKRVGLLGGTFDPVHNGHFAAASSAKKAFSLDTIIFIPAAHPPHKTDHTLSAFQHRVAMLQDAVGRHPAYFVSQMEAEREGGSYTIDTLTLLREQLGSEVQLFFIIGIDAFAEIATWKDYDQLLDRSHFIVIDRPSPRQERVIDAVAKHFHGWQQAPQRGYWFKGGVAGRIYSLRMEPVNVSSTEIRRLVRSNNSVAAMVPSGVEEYIKEHALYR